MRKSAVIGFAVLLGGCQTYQERLNAQLAQYIGQPISEMAIKLGPPVSSFATGQNQMAFQWYKQTTQYTSGSAYRVYGTTIYNPPQAQEVDCRLTLIAETTAKNPQLNDWIARRYEWRGGAC